MTFSFKLEIGEVPRVTFGVLKMLNVNDWGNMNSIPEIRFTNVPDGIEYTKSSYASRKFQVHVSKLSTKPIEKVLSLYDIEFFDLATSLGCDNIKLDGNSVIMEYDFDRVLKDALKNLRIATETKQIENEKDIIMHRDVIKKAGELIEAGGPCLCDEDYNNRCEFKKAEDCLKNDIAWRLGLIKKDEDKINQCKKILFILGGGGVNE